MGCCGESIKKGKSRKKKDNIKYVQYSQAVKSNRVTPGNVAKECPTCKTRTIAPICPICNVPTIEQKN
jgi:hypothetical protein